MARKMKKRKSSYVIRRLKTNINGKKQRKRNQKIEVRWKISSNCKK